MGVRCPKGGACAEGPVGLLVRSKALVEARSKAAAKGSTALMLNGAYGTRSLRERRRSEPTERSRGGVEPAPSQSGAPLPGIQLQRLLRESRANQRQREKGGRGFLLRWFFTSRQNEGEIEKMIKLGQDCRPNAGG